MATESFVHEKTLQNIDKKIINNLLLVLNSFWTVAKSTPKLIVDTIFGNSGNDQGQNNSGGLLGNIARGFGDALSGNAASESKSSVGNSRRTQSSKMDSNKDLSNLVGQLPSSSGGSKRLPSKSKSDTSTKGLREIQERRKQEMYNQRSQPNVLHSANARKPGKFM